MAKGSAQLKKVNGWGADLDPRDRPAVPKEKPSNVDTPRGILPARQVAKIKIHKSPEQPDLTPVFGTSCPPRGLSGKIRDFAYQYSEGKMRHWFALMLADRVDVVEGLMADIARGKIPNFYKEAGLSTEFTHASPERKRRNAMIATAAAGSVVLAFVVLRRLASQRTARSNQERQLISP